jgi:hypothetical protein
MTGGGRSKAMIHELRTYTIVPGRIAEFIELTGSLGRSIRGDRYGELLGYWQTLQGKLGQAVHLWAYPDPSARASLRTAMMEDPRWIGEYVPKSLPMVVEQANLLLLPVDWHPIEKVSGMALYELRTHHLHPGKVPPWMKARRSSHEVRQRYGRSVAVWLTEVGPLNSVVELWSHRDANAWLCAQAERGSDKEWLAAEAEIGPLIRRSESILLAPSDFSPLR